MLTSLFHLAVQIFGNIWSSAAALVWIFAILVAFYFLLSFRTIRRYFPIGKKAVRPQMLRLYLLFLTLAEVLITAFWYTGRYVIDIYRVEFPFLFIVLAITVIFGIPAAILSTVLITPLIIYYLVDPRYTLNIWHHDVQSIAIIITGFIVSIAIGTVVRRYQQVLSRRILEMRELQWRTRQRLAVKTEEEAILKDINQASLALQASPLTLTATLQTVVKEARKLIQGYCAGIALRNGRSFSCEVVVGQFKTAKQKADFTKFYEHIFATAYHRKQLTNVIDTASFLSKKDFTSDKVYRQRILLDEPLRPGQSGIIFVTRTYDNNEFSEKDIQKLHLFATHAALAIKNAQHREELARLIKARDQFASVIAHELKTPLSTIKLYAQLLEKQLPKQQNSAIFSKNLQTIDQEADKITTRVNSMLDFTRINSGKFVLEKSRFSLANLLKERVEILQMLSPEHRFSLEIETVKSTIVGDRLRLEQVVTNLLTNAVKYSAPKTVITIRLQRQQRGYLLEVSDQGQGMTQEELVHAFEPFYQSNGNNRSSKNRSGPGLGLGLYITKSIVELHSGRIWAESKPGKGTSFFIWLPVVIRKRRK